MSQVRRACFALVSAVAIVMGFTPAALALSVPRARANATTPAATATAAHSVNTASASPAGYWLVSAGGSIFSGGAAGFHGSTGGTALNQPIVGMASTPTGHGYWIVASDGGVFSFGDAAFHGSTGAMRLNMPIVGIASTPSGNGYWMVASDGGIFAFGDAAFHGSTGAIHLNRPIVGMTSTASGRGYTLVASDGGIFAFGDARFHGSTGGSNLSQRIVGIASSHSGNGYYMVAADGGIFAFGDAHFYGSAHGIAAGMAVTPSGNGYWVVAANGTVSAFGDAHSFSAVQAAASSSSQLIVGIASSAPTAAAPPPASPATHLKFTTQPSATATGGSDFATQPAVKALDAVGATVRTDTSGITLSVTSSVGGATVACHVGTVSAVDGLATFSGCAIDKVGTYTLTATADGLDSAESTTIDVTLGPAHHLVFVNTAFAAVANAALLVPQPAVRVVDAGGNVITAITPITLSVTQSGATVACTTNPVSTSAGLAQFAGCNLTGLPGSYTLHAAVGNSTVAGTSGTIALATGPATHLVFTNAPFGAAVNGVTLAPQPRVAVEDAGGNIVTGTNSITLSVTGAPSGVSVDCTTNPMATTAGVATFAGCDVTGPPATYTLHATNGTVSGDSGNVVVAAFGAATHLVFTNTALGTVLNGAVLAPQPQVTVEDAADNIVTTATAVTLSVNGGVPTLGCTTNPVTATAGVATFAGCNLTGTAETHTLHASDGTVSGESGTIVLSAFGPPTQLVFTNTAFDPAVNGVALSPQPQVTVEDAAGNTVTTARTIDVSTSSEGAALDCTNNSMTTTAGVATFAGCNLVGTDATYTLHAVSTVGLSSLSGNSGNVVLGTGPAAQLLFTNPDIGSAVNGDTMAPQPEVTVVDAGGNTVTTANSITLTVNQLGGIVTCTTNPMPTTAGVAAFAGCNLAGSAGTYTLHGSNGTVTGDSADIALADFGPATHLVFTNGAFGAAVNAATFTPQPQVTVEDAANNVVTTASSITLSVTGGVPTLACPTSTLTRATTAGVATFAGCNLTGTAGTYTLHATNGAVTGTSGNIVLGAGPATRLVFTSAPFDPAVSGVALAPQPKVTVEDAAGNPVTNATAITLLVSGTPSGVVLSCPGTTTTVSTVAGVATFSGCTVTGPAATYTLFATNTVVTGTSSDVVLSAFGAATHLVFTNTAFGAVVNGAVLTPQPQVTVLDALDHVVTSSNPVTLSVNQNGATIACTTNPTTTTAGVASFAGCNLTGATGTYTVHAAIGVTSVTGDSGNVVLGTGPATQLVFTNTAFGAAANAATFSPQPVVTVEDAGGNTVTSVTSITLSVNEAGATPACTTNPVATSAGVATFAGCNLTGTDGTYTLHATNGTLTGNSGNIVLGTGAATHLAFTNTAFTPAVNGAPLAPQPEVTVLDAGGNTVTAPTTITLTVNGTLANVNCTTNPVGTVAGVATFAGCNVTGPALTYTLHATNGTVTGNSTDVVLAAFGAATHLTFTNSAFGAAVNGAALSPQPQVTVKDAADNTVTTPTSITLTVNGGIPTLDCANNTVATSAGVSTFSGCDLVGPDATYTLHATDGTDTGDSGNIVLGTGPATHIAFTNTAFGTAANGAAFAPQPEVTVLDAGGNIVTTSNSITLSVNELGAAITCTANPAAATAGIATFAGCNLIGVNGTYTLHATNGTLSTNSGDIVLGTGVATQLVFTNSAFAPAVNGVTLAPQPQVTVVDAGGNTVVTENSITLTVNGGVATANCTTNPVPAVEGIATFTGCNVTGPAATYTLHATNGTVVGNSGAIVLAAFGTATQLVFTNTSFAAAVNGAPLAPQPQVTVEDAVGNTVTTATSITLTVNENGAIVTCTTNPLATTAGVSTFAGCNITGAAATYTLHASNGTVTGNGGAIVLAAFGTATQLVFTQPPVANVTSTVVFPTQPVVTVEDAFGNTVTTNATPIVLSIPAGATLACSTPGRFRTPVNGVASWSGCNITGGAATYTITADNGDLPLVTANVNVT
jgi:trimeric autotransporter adhesin